MRKAIWLVHGGEHRAVFIYQMDSYHYWQRILARKTSSSAGSEKLQP